MKEFSSQPNEAKPPEILGKKEEGLALDNVKEFDVFLTEKFKNVLAKNGFESISVFPAQAENGGNAIGIYLKEIFPKEEEQKGDNPFNVLDSMFMVDISDEVARNTYKLQEALVEIIENRLGEK